jgi:pantoate kinase
MQHFAPANISLIFETYDASPPQERGSLGVGITLKQGVTCRLVEGGEPGIFVQGNRWPFPTVASVVSELTAEPIRLEIEAAFPFGCGFGMSGASALSAAYAINEWNTQHGRPTRTRQELGIIAHRAEVANATGLGDVGGQFNGGVMIKTEKYAPLTVSLLPPRPTELYVAIFGPIHTAAVIGSREKLRAVNAAGRRAMELVAQQGDALTLESLLDISLGFSVQSELLQSRKVGSLIDKIKRKGGHASMIMLGEAVVSSIPFPDCQTVEVAY